MRENYIEKIRQYFIDKPIKKAYLFGSYVSGRDNTDSDIDILVELDYTKKIGLYFITMKYELETILDKKVDLVTEKSVSDLIRPYIYENRKLIYEQLQG